MTDDEREQLRIKIWGWNGEEFDEDAFKEHVEQCREDSERESFELWGAGWTSENPNPKYECASMSLYWRRPPKRKGKLGRRYLSTNQAWMALKREAGGVSL